MRSRFEQGYEDVLSEFRGRKVRGLLCDIRNVLEEEHDIMDFFKMRTSEKRFCISADRKKNDTSWSYADFDKALVLIDASCGGVGIFKPVNQLRVIRWNASESDLVFVLRHLASAFPSMDFKSVLVMRYAHVDGHRILKKVFKT